MQIIDEEKKRQEEGTEEEAGTSNVRKAVKCANCQQLSHNKRTCTVKV